VYMNLPQYQDKRPGFVVGEYLPEYGSALALLPWWGWTGGKAATIMSVRLMYQIVREQTRAERLKDLSEAEERGASEEEIAKIKVHKEIPAVNSLSKSALFILQ